jgi:hypothetical protein
LSSSWPPKQSGGHLQSTTVFTAFNSNPAQLGIRGLSDQDIEQYEGALGISFTGELRTLLKFMNGTDLVTLNVYGSSGESERLSVGVYSFPDDLEAVQDRITYVKTEIDQKVLTATLAQEGFNLSQSANLVPIYAHRYVVCSPGTEDCPVLSIWAADDVVIYGHTLRDYLIAEFLNHRQ